MVKKYKHFCQKIEIALLLIVLEAVVQCRIRTVGAMGSL